MFICILFVPILKAPCHKGLQYVCWDNGIKQGHVSVIKLLIKETKAVCYCCALEAKCICCIHLCVHVGEGGTST